MLAPITGRVSRHLVSVGNLVQGSDGGATLLTSIVSLDPIHVYFDMDESIYLRNNKLWFEGKRPSSRDTPNPVQITLTGETKPSHDGKMDFLDNRLDVSTGTLRGRAIVANKDLSILPGQFARVRLIGSAPYEALLMPDTAIATDQSRKIVFVVKDDNTVEARPVMLGPLDDGLRVIREGLKADDRVIVDGLQRARVGAKVDAAPGRSSRRRQDMNLGRLSINQPILAMVLSIVLLIVGAIAYTDAAGFGISASGAADRGGHHAISRRFGADRLRYRRRSDRAGDQRRRGHAVPLQPGHLEWPAHHHGHLQARHRPRQGAGAGAEPRRDRAAAVARGSAAQRRRHPQEQPRHPDGRVHAVARRLLRPALYLNYALLQVRDQLLRLDGVGDIQIFGARDYSMRLWLDPDKIATLGMTAGEVLAAIRAQNVQIAGGQIAEPPIADRAFQPNLDLHRPPEGSGAIRGYRAEGRR